MQVIIRDMGVFNDTLMAELLEELGRLRETDIVLVNWGAWYPRFTWGYSEVTSGQVSCTEAACTLPCLPWPGNPCPVPCLPWPGNSCSLITEFTPIM